MRTIPYRSCVFALLLVAACGGDDENREGDGQCSAVLLPGDVVISEIMANPPGPDDGAEWFELYNATGTPLDLTGATLAFEKADGTGQKSHAIDGLVLEPGDYVVVGGVLDEEGVRPAHVDYGYGGDLGTMNNSAGRLSIACGTTIIDTTLYEEPADGASRGFDGNRTPDAMANDDLAAWCDAQTAFGDEALATPGEPNDPCFGSAPTSCIDEGVEREIVAPAPGDLVISEIMPNPSAIGDNEGEWFEVYVVHPVDLNGLEIGKAGDEVETTVGDTSCVSVQSGDYILFARLDDPAANGGLAEVDQTFSFSLSNSDAGMFIGWGGEVLDEVSWGSSFDGASLNLDPDRFDTTANDDPVSFCRATEPYGDGDFGTPGGPNSECMIPPPAGQCMDGGELRDTVPPAAGDLVITEVMPNPAAVGDTEGEWFEVRAEAAFDLNGLELGRTEAEDTIEVEACLSVQPGEHVIFAKNPDMATNGGLPAVDAEFSFSLVNSDGRLFVGIDGEVLDEVAWSSSSSGAALSVDPAQATVEGNDDPANWCDASVAYGDGDLGTPGEENPSCGTVSDGTCDDNGTPREIVPPQAGDVVITEVMPNPATVSDADGEWFELLVNADVDLNGLQMGQTEGEPDTTLPPGGECLAVSSGTRVIFARDADPLVNGGLPDTLGTFSFGLVNSDGTLYVGLDGETLDTVGWTTSSAGASLSVDPASENPTDNDDPANWCDASSPYGDGDLGTPAGANDSCG